MIHLKQRKAESRNRKKSRFRLFHFTAKIQGLPCSVMCRHLPFISGYNIAIITAWLKDDCKKSIKEISNVIRYCIFGRE